MSKVIKIFLYIVLFLGIGLIKLPVRAEEAVNVYFFYSDTCFHCQAEELYLNNLKDEYGARLKINQYEVIENKANQAILKKVAELYNYQVRGVPITVVGEQTFTGFLNAETTGQEILRQIDRCLAIKCPDKLSEYLQAQNQPPQLPSAQNNIPEFINFPLIGQIKIQTLSLPLLTLIIGLADGFNPCAMWVLMYLVSLLLGINSQKRRWLLGGVFIIASSAVYFLFMAAWLNLFLFLGLIGLVRIIIGLSAIIMGGYNLQEYWINRPGCKVVQSESRQKIFRRLREITQRTSLFWALGGIILLAFAVNLVELICSAGFPAIYTQVLALTQMPWWQHYLYLFAYIFFFMLDDLVIFVVAMITLKSVGLSGKYSRFSDLIGGLVILILGLLLIFRPTWLMLWLI